jgi:ketosteroid isomerase-like protein
MSEAPSDAEKLEIARRLIAAISAGDVDAVAALYHEDLIGWRNVDRRELNRRQMLKIIGFLASGVKDLRYDDVRVATTPRGYVQQHVLRATAPDGRAVEVPACLVVEIAEGQIRRIDEYMDAAALAPLWG